MKPGKPAKPAPSAGSAHRDKMAARSRAQSAGVKEVGPLPPVADPARRERCRTSLKLFFTTYTAARFPLPFSPDHDAVIAKLEACITGGGLFAVAMPRGNGKTTMVEAAIVWALLYGYRKYVLVLAATGKLAADLVASIKSELETNELLAADFPEACVPVRRLDGIAQRGKGQTLNGERTRVEWGAGEFALAVVPGAPSSGGIVEAKGLDSAIRGRKRPAPGGGQLRPDLCVLDDPQTDLSARMLGQCDTRERLINGAVLGLGGPDREVAAIMPCTCIVPDDLSDRFLAKPEWRGERTKMMYAPPSNAEWWTKYADLRRESFARFGDTRLSDALYAAERATADAGCVVAWPERFDPKKAASAVQYAMNWKIDRPESFAAECQNDPVSLTPEADALALDPTTLARRLTGVPRGTIPRDCTMLTAGVDVSESVLWWVVVGWDAHFGGSVVDYGCWPGQRRAHFRQDEASPSLRDKFPDQPIEACVFAGLRELFAELLGRQFPGEAGEPRGVDRLVIDSGDRTKEVHQAVTACAHRARVTPSKGYGISALGKPVREWPKSDPERRGQDWVFNPKSGRWLLKFDANPWKTFVGERYRTAEAAPGALRLPGEEPFAHQLYAEHCGAEYPVRNESEGRVVHVWKQRPGRENHLFDCTVLAALAASFQGLRWSPKDTAAGAPPPRRGKRRKRDIEAMHAAANPGGA